MTGWKELPNAPYFLDREYQEIDKARLDALKPCYHWEGASVIDLGAGAGAFSDAVLEWGAKRVICYEGRRENADLLRARLDRNKATVFEVNLDQGVFMPAVDVVLCFGLLYHLRNWRDLFDFTLQGVAPVLFVETQVRPKGAYPEGVHCPTQGLHATVQGVEEVELVAALERNGYGVEFPVQPNHYHFRGRDAIKRRFFKAVLR